MIIKKYQGKTEEAALVEAKKELGDGVVIMNVKKVKQKGFFSFIKPQLTEVTVAKEEESDRVVTAEKKGPVYINSGLGAAVASVANIAKKSEQTIQEDADDSFFTDGVGKVSVEGDKVDKLLGEKLDNLQLLLKQQILERDAEEGRAGQDTVKGEADSVTEESSESMEFMKLLYSTMIENEVNETYANQIIDEITRNCKPDMPIDYILSNVYQKMILKFDKPLQIMPAKKGPKVVFFIGPTGVGKTTTIAKLASKFCIGQKSKIVLLTADTYRIAAADQLRTYANILEVPFRVIYTVDEIKEALTEFADYDYIMVDTAGHSHQNETQRENMNLVVHSVDGLAEKEVFLVLSATTKYRDLISIAETYQKLTEYKVIFTKLDETTTLGNLLNIKLFTGAPLSYVTCGQNVPDDIENFNPQDTVKLLLGGKKSE